jgi:hypothetical protein
MSITLMSQQDTAKRIVTIANGAKSLQTDIHETAVSCLAHVRDHGDTTLAVRLLAVLPSGQRRNTLAQWFKVYSNGKMSLVQDKNKVWSCKLKQERVATDFLVDEAMTCEYGDLEPEAKAGKPKTLAQLVAAIAAFTKNDKTVVIDGVVTPIVSPELVKAAQKALTAITA